MCEVCHERHRPDLNSDAAEASVSAPFFCRGELVEGSDADAPLARPRRDLRHAEDRPQPRRSIRAPRCRRCSTCRWRRSSTSWSRPASGSAIPNNPFIQDCIDRMCATHILPRERRCETQVKARRRLPRQAAARWPRSSRTSPTPRRSTSGCPSRTSPAARASSAPSRRG